MNRRYNQPMYQQLPAMAVEAHCQQSMYQQHTYMDRSRMAVTDTIYVQEHVSQSSWAMSAPSPRMRTPVYAQAGRAPPYMGNGGMAPQAAPSLSHPCPPPPTQASQQQSHAYAPGQQSGRFGYVPNIQYYASSSASMNTNGQLYVLCCAPNPNRPQHQQQMTKDNSTQTQGIVKRSRDASTQTDLIGDAPPMPQPQQEMGDNKACNNNTSLFDFIGDGQQYGTLQGNLRNSEVLLPKQRLKEITHISLYGSSIAEQVASAHRQRPCFKKMDTLCARLKQDLLRPDGVLPNINSQGIAWAVKDFIFVFTRIVNSWILLKGYVYNTPEGLNKIKDELPDGFMGAFDCWQITTLTMVEMIIKSFVNLDAMLQNQKNSFTKMDMHNRNCNNNDSSSDSNSSNKTLNGIDISTLENGPNAFSTPRKSTDPEELNPLLENNDNLDDNNMNYLYTMVQDSEEAQRCVNANGTYLKTGTYTPLLKEANPVEQPQLSQSPPKSKPMDWKPTVNWQQTVESAKAPIKTQLPKLKAQCRHKDVKPYSTPLSVLRREMTRKLVELSNRIMLLQHIDRFFQKQFTLNYYPYFYERCHSEFIDVRAIILKCESASYQHISQPVHDLRRIIFLVRRDLKDHTNMDLRLYTALYERAINEMLSKSPYQLQQFEHITGNPIEKFFSSDI
ncbi:protein mitoshell [Drosophila sulfurigaster albostrigata]|uniref:protein mitoshell n=1 Tax=Drosophila sulfurigaster albostrigata TaxID=89887 RepID=UPI002D21D042|nr:protein mitoshell [Drosophila sulfurigaster albostrigata]XP_062133755.1 protein mitoshell [Drosophila sulfurigaster albostrigata]